MITGYFYCDVIKSNREIHQIQKIFQLVVEANLLYLLWDSICTLLSHNGDFFSNTLTLKNLIKFLVLNESPMKGHLWYLGAILYVLIIVYALDKLKIGKALYFATPFLLLGDLIFGKYSIVIWGREYPYILVRNFLFVGIPYFCIGRLIRNGFGKKIGKRKLNFFVVVFAATTLLERFILVSKNMNAVRDHYISTTFLALAVFLLTLRCSGENRGLAVVGRKYSTWMYILHPVFITCIGVAIYRIGLYGCYRFVAPFVVYVSTLAFLMVTNRIRRSLNI